MRRRLPRPGAPVWPPFAAGSPVAGTARPTRLRDAGPARCGGHEARCLPPAWDAARGDPRAPGYAGTGSGDRRALVPGIVVSRGSCLPPRSPARSCHPGRAGTCNWGHGSNGSPAGGGTTRLGSSGPHAGRVGRVGRGSAGRAFLPPPPAEVKPRSREAAGDFHAAAPVGCPAPRLPPRGFCAACAARHGGAGRGERTPPRPPGPRRAAPGEFFVNAELIVVN